MNVAASTAKSVAERGEEKGWTLSDQTVQINGPTAPIEILRIAKKRSRLANIATLLLA